MHKYWASLGYLLQRRCEVISHTLAINHGTPFSILTCRVDFLPLQYIVVFTKVKMSEMPPLFSDFFVFHLVTVCRTAATNLVVCLIPNRIWTSCFCSRFHLEVVLSESASICWEYWKTIFVKLIITNVFRRKWTRWQDAIDIHYFLSLYFYSSLLTSASPSWQPVSLIFILA